MFVGNQNFAADAGECAEKGGRLRGGIGSGIQVVIKKEKRSGFLIENKQGPFLFSAVPDCPGTSSPFINCRARKYHQNSTMLSDLI